MCDVLGGKNVGEIDEMEPFVAELGRQLAEI